MPSTKIDVMMMCEGMRRDDVLSGQMIRRNVVSEAEDGISVVYRLERKHWNKEGETMSFISILWMRHTGVNVCRS